MRKLKKYPLFMAVVMFVTMIPLGGITPAGAAPLEQRVYKVSEFTAINEGFGSRITNQTNLLAFSVGAASNNASRLRLATKAEAGGTDVDRPHPGRVGTFLRDGTPSTDWNGVTNNARNTVIEPLPHMDGSIAYPVTEISGYRTLTHAAFTSTARSTYKTTGRRGSTFYMYKSNETTAADLEAEKTRYRYYAANFIISASEDLGFSILTSSPLNPYANFIMDKDGNITAETGNDTNYHRLYYVGGNSEGGTTSLMDFLVSVDGQPADEALLLAAAEELTRKTSLSTKEHWVHYRMYWGENNAVLELTLTLDIPGENPEDSSVEKEYKFLFSLHNPPSSESYERILAVGGRLWNTGNPALNLNYPNYYDDITVKYASEPDICSVLDSRIAVLPAVEDLTLDDDAVVAEIGALETAVYNLSVTDKQRMKYLDKLYALVDRLAELISEDVESELITFEPHQSGIESFEAVNAASPDGWAAADNPNRGGVNTSPTVLRFTRNWKDGAAGNLRAVYKLTDALVPGDKLISNISGKVYVGAGSSPTLIYDYKNENRWQGLQLNITADSGVGILPVSYSGGDALSIAQSYDRAFVRLDSEKAAPMDATGLWIEFNLEYTLLDCYMTMRAYGTDGKLYTGQFPMRRTLVDTSETKFGLCIGSGNGYVDDLRVNYQDTEEYIKSKVFLEDHSYILNLFPVDTYLSDIDRGYVAAIADDYAALADTDPDVLRYLPLMDTRIANIQAALTALDAAPDAAAKAARDQALLAARNEASAQGDYLYTYRYDFTDGLRAFQPARDTMVNPADMVTEYNEDFGSYVLKAGRYSIATLKKPLLPDNSLLVGISFRTKPAQATVDSASGRFRVFTRYQSDSTMYSYAFHQAATAVRAGYRGSTGSLTSPSQATGVTTDLDINTVWRVNIEYIGAGNRLSTRMTITDGKNNSLITTQSAGTAEAAINNLLALGGSGIPMYMADLEVTYRRGNYDVNQKNDDIIVNYAGNTWVNPGDVALISGENLTENVLKAEILTLPNGTGASKGFIDRTWFDYDGVHEGEFSANPVSAYWNADEAQDITFVQKTPNSLKFIVPEDLENGIYAVRLYSSKGGGYKTIYMNNPSVDYTVGTDGAIAAAGSDLRVIGKNLAPDESTEKLKAYIVTAAGAAREAVVSAAQSKYSLSVALPSDLANGEYELWLYSGYGDATAWTIPVKFTVGTPVRAGWSDKVFNVKDYGATGLKSQNATPYIVNALAAVSANGGGILYFPRGTYSLESELILPKNMVFRGETTGSTILFFRPYKQAYNELSWVLLAESNVEVSNLTVDCERIGGILGLYGPASDNVYIENVELKVNPVAGQATDGSNTTFTNLLPSNELYAMATSELVKPLIQFQRKGSNVQLRNMDASNCFGKNRCVFNDLNGSYYWQVDNVYLARGWSEIIISNSLWENSKHFSACLGVWGHGTYFQNNELFDRYDNNRELYVADRSSDLRTTLVPVAGNSLEYDIVGKLNASNLRDADMQIYVNSGVGFGQTRMIVSSRVVIGENGNEASRVTLNRPFTIAPNRNSAVIIRRPRENIFFVDGKYENGTAGGFYGGCADVIYDGNRWRDVSGIYQNTMANDHNWYMSFINEDVKSENRDMTGYNWQSMSGTNSQMAFIMRNCVIDGQRTNLRPNSANSLVDMILDSNTYINLDYAFSLYVATADTNIDGGLMYRNSYNNVSNLFETATSQRLANNLMVKTNNAGSKRLMILEARIPDEVLLGDANLDGRVSLKDSTLIQYHLLGMVELTEHQLLRANVDGDDKVTLRDATMIRMYLLGQVTAFVE